MANDFIFTRCFNPLRLSAHRRNKSSTLRRPSHWMLVKYNIEAEFAGKTRICDSCRKIVIKKEKRTKPNELSSEHQEETASEHQEETASEHQDENASEHQEETASEHQEETASEHQEENATEHQEETASEHQEETASEHQEEIATEHQEKSATVNSNVHATQFGATSDSVTEENGPGCSEEDAGNVVMENILPTLTKTLLSLNQTPVQNWKLRRSKRYAATKFEAFKKSLGRKVFNVSVCDEEETNCGVLNSLKRAFSVAPNIAEKIKLLALLPQDWSFKKIAADFECTRFMIKTSKDMSDSGTIFTAKSEKRCKVLPVETI